MKFTSALFAILSTTSLAVAAPYENHTMVLADLAKKDILVQAPSSHEPGRDIPLKVSDLQMIAAFAQQTYCLDQSIGTKVGDGEIVWSYGDGWFNQRATIINSKSVGLVLSFQGTSATDIKGWIEDYSFLLHPPHKALRPKLEPGSQLETGFQKAYMGLADKVLDGVAKMSAKYNNSKITITGHSLGAAIAEIATVHINTVNETLFERAIVFGLPRVGNIPWANSVDNMVKDKYYYVLNGRDIAGFVPSRVFGYQHPSG